MIPNLARKKTKTFRLRAAAWIVIFVFGSVSVCQGYSVLTHEAIIDSAWDEGIKPLLLQRFPGATREDLKTAHSYAYGGCVIQDLGYYPFGSHLFSDLLHYIRTGDFVQALIRDSQDLNEYAFYKKVWRQLLVLGTRYLVLSTLVLKKHQYAVLKMACVSKSQG